MRPYIGALALIASAAAAACGSIDEFEHVMSDEATIPGTVGQTGPFQLDYNGSFDGLSLSNADSFDNAGVSPDDVDAIYVKSVRMEGTKEIDHLDVLFESVAIWVEAPGVPRVTVAGTSQFTPMSNVADLMVMSELNLKPYATAEKMTVGTDTVIKQRPAFETTIRTTITLLIDVNIPGI